MDGTWKKASRFDLDELSRMRRRAGYGGMYYDRRVNRRLHTFVAVAAILLMAVSQMCELFDRWDTIADVGHDSEFMFIVIGMCIGLCLLLALLIVRLVRTLFLLVMRLLRGMSPAAQTLSYGTEYLLQLFSPPLSFTSLRI